MFRALDRFTHRLCKLTALLCMVALFVILLANVVIRFTGLPIKMSWYSEMAEILFAYMVFSMSAALGHDKAHFAVDLLQQKFASRRWYPYAEAAAGSVALLFYVFLLIYGVKLFNGAHQSMPVLGIPKRWAYFSVPLCGAFLSVYTLRDVLSSLGAVWKKREEC